MLKNQKQITANNRPVCKNCHHCRSMSGVNVKACHWSLDYSQCRPFIPQLNSCEGYKPREDYVKPIKYSMTDEEKEAYKAERKRIAECNCYANRLKGWNRAQGVRR